MSAKDDLKLLFDNYVAWRSGDPPVGPDLVPDLGIDLKVEHEPGITLSFESRFEARMAAKCHQPRYLPRITKERPIYYWVRYDVPLGDWRLIEYTQGGQFERGRYPKASLAYDALLEARARIRAGKPPPPPAPKVWRLPEPPYRCWCGTTFESAEAILAHRHTEESH